MSEDTDSDGASLHQQIVVFNISSCQIVRQSPFSQHRPMKLRYQDLPI